MVLHFTTANWDKTVNTRSGQKKAIELTLNDSPIPEDILIQVFETYPNNEHGLIQTKPSFGITIVRDAIIIFCDQPFNGKVVIK